MSEDSYTEVTSESWFERITAAIKGVLVGIVLFLVSFPLLWWNEGRAVDTAKGISQFGANVAPVPADTVDPKNDKKAVHLTGEATTKETLTDPQFKVSEPAIKLRRNVEMYQWKQSEDSKSSTKVGGSKQTTTTYKYDKTWSDKLIKSSEFKDPKAKEENKNPEAMRFSAAVEKAEVVKLGAFRLPEGLVSAWNDFAKVPFRPEQAAKLPEDLASQATTSDDVLYLPNAATGKKPDPAKPEVGDLRITFQVVKPGMVSIVAKQVGDTFESWTSSTGTSIFELQPGAKSKEEMVKTMEGKNATLTWVLRLVGFVLMALGLGLVFNPLAVLADVLPFFGDLLRMGIGLFAIVIAAALSLLTISVAWIVYRPLLGIPLLAVAIGLIVMFVRMGKSRKAAKAAPVPVKAR
jgi:hypothetical protein